MEWVKNHSCENCKWSVEVENSICCILTDNRGVYNVCDMWEKDSCGFITCEKCGSYMPHDFAFNNYQMQKVRFCSRCGEKLV